MTRGVQDFIDLALELLEEVKESANAEEFKGLMWFSSNHGAHVAFCDKDETALVDVIIDHNSALFSTCKVTFRAGSDDDIRVFDALYDSARIDLDELLNSDSKQLITNQIKSVLKNGIRFSKN